MPERCRPTLARVFILVAGLVGLAGCDHFAVDELDVREAASHLPPYQTTIDHPKTLIDTALDRCPDKTEERETTCVKQALSSGALSVAVVAGMVPGCRLGRVCVYHHKTEDRLGYVPAIAAEFVVRWRVDFDLRHAAKTARDIPVTVAQEE